MLGTAIPQWTERDIRAPRDGLRKAICVINITVTEPGVPERRRRLIEPITVDQITSGELQEGQQLDFKRMVDLEKIEGKKGLLDDVVAFLNRGSGRIVVGVEEKGGKYDSFRPMAGDPDKAVLRFQTLIQDSISPLPIDVQVVPLDLDEGFILDIQLPSHLGGPFMNRLSGSYLIRSGSRNLPIDPGTLRSRFVDETMWMSQLGELTAAEDAKVAESGRLVLRQALRIAILPREHFDHQREPFSQRDHVRYPGPVFHQYSSPMFRIAEDGHEIYAMDMRSQGLERLFLRDDWFIHGHVGYAISETQGERRLQLPEFDEAVRRYLGDIAAFLGKHGIEGPFAVTFALQGLVECEHFGDWFPNTSIVRTLRPRLVQDVDDPVMVADFLRRVRQASRYG